MAVFLSATVATAAPPDVQTEYKVPPGQPLRIVVKGTDIGYKATFKDDEAFFDELYPRDGGRRFLFQAPAPGKYSIVFWTKGETDGVVTTVTVGDGKGPLPPPDDNQKKDKKAAARLVIITDRENTTAARLVNTYFNNASFNEYYKKAFNADDKHPWGSISKSAVGPDGNPPVNEGPLIRASVGKTYPQYFVVAEDWSIIEQGDLPTDPSAMVTILQRFRR